MFWKETKVFKKSSGGNRIDRAIDAINDQMDSIFNDSTEKELAELLCSRLNQAILDPEIRRIAQQLFRTKSQVTAGISANFGLRTEDGKAFLSTLGLLNGLLEEYKIIAVYGKNRDLIRFDARKR